MNGMELELTGSELWDKIHRAADVIGRRTGAGQTAVMNRAYGLVAMSKGGRAPEDVAQALYDMAEEVFGSAALSAADPVAVRLSASSQPQDDVLEFTGPTRAYDFEDFDEGQAWARSEELRLCDVAAGMGMGIRLTPPRVGDAWDDALGTEFDQYDDALQAEIDRISAKYNATFPGKNARPGPLGTAGVIGSWKGQAGSSHAAAGCTDPDCMTDHSAPRLGGRGGHPEAEAIVARNPSIFGSGAQIDRSGGNRTHDASGALAAGRAARDSRLGAGGLRGGPTPGQY